MAAFFWYQWMELKGMAGGQQQPQSPSGTADKGSAPANDTSSSNGSEAGRLSRASSQASLAKLAAHQVVQVNAGAGDNQQEDQQSLLQNEQ